MLDGSIVSTTVIASDSAHCVIHFHTNSCLTIISAKRMDFYLLRMTVGIHA